jgi:hypothetical protein
MAGLVQRHHLLVVLQADSASDFVVLVVVLVQKIVWQG